MNFNKYAPLDEDGLIVALTHNGILKALAEAIRFELHGDVPPSVMFNLIISAKIMKQVACFIHELSEDIDIVAKFSKIIGFNKHIDLNKADEDVNEIAELLAGNIDLTKTNKTPEKIKEGMLNLIEELTRKLH